MNILNDIACNLNWIKIQIKFKYVEWNSNSIEKKLDANWHIKYWKFACVNFSNIEQFFLELVLKINKYTFKKNSIPLYLRIN